MLCLVLRCKDILIELESQPDEESAARDIFAGEHRIAEAHQVVSTGNPRILHDAITDLRTQAISGCAQAITVKRANHRTDIPAAVQFIGCTSGGHLYQ